MLTVKEGNYAIMGVIQEENKVYITFEGEKEEQCKVVLLNHQTKEKEIIEVPDEYVLGSLRSIEIDNININEYDYYFEINGQKRIDPYSRKIVGREKWNNLSRKNNSYEIYSSTDKHDFNWKNDKQPEIPKDKMIMYKLHVRGFSMDTKKEDAGTFSAIKDKIPFLKSLGITTIELMPIYEFEEMKIKGTNLAKLPDYVKWTNKSDDVIVAPKKEKKTVGVNYWGYVPGNYFAVKTSYAYKKDRASIEFKELVHELHKNNMECVMEMFFGGNLNHNLILDSLRYWVREFHVDGFHLLGNNLPITAIAQNVMLSRTKIFYDDIPGDVLDNQKTYKHLYLYKDEYLYQARKILNHINGDMSEFINQQKKQNSKYGFVNYVASNNGFTLADVFMFNDRHNEANGENNSDGNAWNFSNNCGFEGFSQKKYIKFMRQKQWRNALVMLFMAQGVPLILSGDEIQNSQKGNNNAYCQDNKIGWVNWKKGKSQDSDIEFVKNIIKFRNDHPMISNTNPYYFNDCLTKGMPDVSFHGESAWVAGIDKQMMALGEMYYGEYDSNNTKESIYVAYNFFSGVSTLALPSLPENKQWHLLMDTSLEKKPFLKEAVKLKNQQKLTINAQSIKILIGK
ncbi:alpha-amylase family glycosyl hydrolase [Lachnobacterium bovis]|uniref:Glycogen operon protein n=2 Tax=Lachnobacterium bovis TaxID=140626 RepID=A0A1H9Q785_9FIRM|nr:alpha-amylase family glycosyl hydrolase [Lachnobacterium bovis]SER56426.1 glycogen operon protein [Lachnobacterium bovis]